MYEIGELAWIKSLLDGCLPSCSHTVARFSNVLAVASVDFIGEYYTDGSYLANESLMTSLINTCAGRVSETYTIQDKQIDYSSFTPTQTHSYIISAICVYIIPILTVALGVVLFVLRKRR